ncbi:MAG: hemolysin family protein [Pseudomonadota bacterium]
MSIAVLILVLAICLLLEGFFSGSEMALVTADKYRLALATDAGSRRALSALHMVKHPAKFFTTTLLGTNLCTVTASVVTAFFIIRRFGPEYAPLAILCWPFTLVLGEIVPKSICQHYADRIVLRVAPALFGVSVALYPVVWALSKITDSLLGGIRRHAGSNPPLSREELELMLEVGRPEGSDVKPMERTLISRIFDLADKRVKGIMTPLVDVVAIPITAERAEAEGILERHGFSRIPVYEGRVFNMVGFLSGADLLFGEEKCPVKDILKPAYYVPEEMPLDELLVSMRRRGEPMAVAVDEYGAATGIVTVEDLLEEVVGEIRDEHDDAAVLYRRVGWHHYLVSGRMEVAEANDKLKLEIPEGEYKTIAGFVIHRMEKIPRVGEGFKLGRFKLTVVHATERSVVEVEVAQVSEEEQG